MHHRVSNQTLIFCAISIRLCSRNSSTSTTRTTMDDTIQTFDATGVTLHFSKTGSGPPLIFIPGSVSDYRTWTNIQSHFADSYECYLISRRFQFPGKYPSGGESTVAANTNDIAAFIKEMELSPAAIIGHSFCSCRRTIFCPCLSKKSEEPA